eukprot:COSAG01_NODE_21042_length_921_cov_0.895377_1_plen_98_part_00
MRRRSGVSRLAGMGFDVSALSGSVLAGEEAIQHMLQSWSPGKRNVARGPRVTWLAWGGADFEPSYLDGLDATLVGVEDAELLCVPPYSYFCCPVYPK